MSSNGGYFSTLIAVSKATEDGNEGGNTTVFAKFVLSMIVILVLSFIYVLV